MAARTASASSRCKRALDAFVTQDVETARVVARQHNVRVCERLSDLLSHTLH
jgi:hypothetical protein